VHGSSAEQIVRMQQACRSDSSTGDEQAMADGRAAAVQIVR
jgi:hypothetical protein